MEMKQLATITFGFLFTSSLVIARPWTEAATGRSVEGEFRRLNGDQVEILRENGTLLKLPLAKLSDEDKTFVAEQEAAASAKRAEVERPKATHKKGEELKEGDIIDLSFRPIEGDKVDLAAMKGKVVLLDFWATWCPPCVAEMPNVVKAYEEYHEKGFEIIGISLDQDERRLKDYIKENKMPWPQHFDGKGWDNELAKEYGVRSIPAVFLLKDNEIIATGVRGSRLEEKLKELLD